MLASLSEQIQLPFSLDLVEAMAVERALSFAIELGFSRFVLEGDSELVIKALNSNEDSLAPFGHILDVAKTTTDVNCISFSYTHRLGNSVAHNLAKTCKTCCTFKGMDGGYSFAPLFYIINQPWLIYFNEVQDSKKKKKKKKTSSNVPNELQ